jgi:ParB-like chromosome segregation protein Spo0J
VEYREITSASVDSIDCSNRLRGLNTEKAEELAASMAQSGLMNPIWVTWDGDDGYHLIAGLHRVEAASF